MTPFQDLLLGIQTDTTGLEPGWDTPINDYDDWADLAPDDTTFPRLFPVR